MEGRERGELTQAASIRSRELQKLLDGGLGADGRGTVAQAWQLASHYQLAIGDLLRARKRDPSGGLAQHLESTLRRAYAAVHARERPGWGHASFAFLVEAFPRLVREEARAVMLSWALLAVGGLVGGAVMATDPGALAVVVPDMHQEQTPEERVRDEAYRTFDLGGSAVFSSVLFTHNIQVTFLVFALGLTFGVGTAAVLFWNGVPIGALAVQYFVSDRGAFFLAWILPHGVLELTAVAVAGAGGFVLARALLRPGTASRQRALAGGAKRAVGLILGCIPMLIVAGLVEGTVSQMHPPELPYSTKLCFAVAMAVATFAYLNSAGRSPPRLGASWRARVGE